MQVSVKGLNKENPEFSLYHGIWKNIGILNEAGVKLTLEPELFLRKPPKEQYEVYQLRIASMCYTPVLGTIGGYYSSALFRRNPTLSAPEEYNQFLSNCDRQGTSYIDLWREVFDNLFLYGCSWLMVDLPKPTTEINSLLDEQEQGLDQPYLVNYTPDKIINWAVNDYNDLEWVCTKRYEESNEFLGPAKAEYVWTYYDRVGWKEYRAPVDVNNNIERFQAKWDDATQATLTAQGTHALTKYNMVPFKRVSLPKNLWIANRTYHQLVSYFNEENNLAWSTFQSSFATLVLKSDKDLNPSVGPTTYIQIPAGDGSELKYIEPSGISAKQSAERLIALKDEIYRCAYLMSIGRDSSATSSSSSGVSKAMDWQASNEILNFYGDKLRTEMNMVLRMVALARDDKDLAQAGADKGFEVSGFRFESKPITQEIASADMFLALEIPSDTARNLAMKRVCQSYFEDASQAILTTMATEIDAAPTIEEVQAQQAQTMFQQSFEKADNRSEAKDELGSVNDSGV